MDDHQAARSEPINERPDQVVPKASSVVEAAMAKASAHPKPSSAPIRHRRWSYDALEEDQKRSLRMLSPLEAAKLIPELEPLAPLATMSSSLDPMRVQQQLDVLSADLFRTQEQSLACVARQPCSSADTTAISSHIRRPPGLDVSHVHFGESSTSDTAAACSSYTEKGSEVVQPWMYDTDTTFNQSHAEWATHKDLNLNQDHVSITDVRFVGEGSLRQDLELLRGRNHECVLVVRKIKQLGFQSPNTLAAHFSKQGVVEEVLVAHTKSPSRMSAQKKQVGRIRPAAMGFIVMRSVEDAKRILQQGELQDVLGAKIQVHPFSSFAKQYEGISYNPLEI